MSKHQLNEVLTIVEGVTKANIRPEEVMESYDKWTSTYDMDTKVMQYKGHLQTAVQVNEFCKDRLDVRILDVGAGTGISGKELYQYGFRNIDALEPNKNMLQQARKAGCYKLFYQEFLNNERLPIENGTYDVVTACGAMLPGHCNEECFEEVMRILKPGGLFIFSMGQEYPGSYSNWMDNFHSRIQQLDDEGKWKVILRKKEKKYKINTDGIVYVIQTSV